MHLSLANVCVVALGVNVLNETLRHRICLCSYDVDVSRGCRTVEAGRTTQEMGIIEIALVRGLDQRGV